MKNENKKVAGKGENAGAGKGAGFPAIKLSEHGSRLRDDCAPLSGGLKEGDRQAGFALLAVAAAALAAYALFFLPPADTPSDMDTFVGRVLGAPAVSLFFDMRNTPQGSASRIYQCGVDIAGGSLCGSKTVTTYACANDGCISANSASNGSNALTYDTVQKKLRETPYVLVRSGAPSTKFFLNHAEISVDESFNASCKMG